MNKNLLQSSKSYEDNTSDITGREGERQGGTFWE